MNANERELLLKDKKSTKLQVGLILNFKRAKLEWRRIVLEENRE